MSRVAKSPVSLPKGVEASLSNGLLTIKSSKGSLELNVNEKVNVDIADGVLSVAAKTNEKFSRAMSGTVRSLIQNMVTGVTDGFEKKLELVGVGYRAQVKGKILNLTLGFSHPVDFEIPEGISIEAPSQTQLVVKGINKQQVGQVAANIRAYREPEPYKGKGIKYADEIIRRKEAKKK